MTKTFKKGDRVIWEAPIGDDWHKDADTYFDIPPNGTKGTVTNNGLDAAGHVYVHFDGEKQENCYEAEYAELVEEKVKGGGNGELRVGVVVRLRSGGPKMTVKSVWGEGSFVDVVFFDEVTGALCAGEMLIDLLEVVV